METASDDRLSRSKTRREWSVRAYELGNEPGANLRDSTTASQRLGMMWELAQQSWSLAGRPFPEFPRHQSPGRIVQLSE